MKICLVNSLYYPYARGGTEDIVRILAEYLSEQGHSVFIITTDPKKYKRPHILREKQGKITIYRIGGYHYLSFYNLSEIGPFLRQFWHFNDIFAFKSKVLFKEIIDDIQPDLIWVHNLKGLGYSLTKYAHQHSAKFWMTVHDVQYYDPSGLIIYKKITNPIYYLARIKYQLFVKLNLSKPDLLISPSKWLLNFYKSKGFFKNTNSVVLLNPLPMFKNTEVITTNGKFIYAGQLEKHKGILTLIEAINKFNSLSRDKIDLDIYGRGSLQNIIPVNKNIQYKGWVDFLDLPDIMSKYSLLIMPSICYENSPTIIRLAKLVNLPVIGVKHGGVPELLDERENDYLFTAGSVDDLILQIKKFQNRKLSHKLRPLKKDIIMSVQDYWEVLSAKL